MTCQQLLALLIDYVADEVSTEHRVEIIEHVSCCSSCRIYVETYQITIKLSRRLPCQPMPERLVQRLQAVVDAMRRDPSGEAPRNC